MKHVIRNKDNHKEFIKDYSIFSFIVDIVWGNFDECRVFNQAELNQWTNENDRVKDRIKQKCPHAEFIEVELKMKEND